jgi:hypothetical protein
VGHDVKVIAAAPLHEQQLQSYTIDYDIAAVFGRCVPLGAISMVKRSLVNVVWLFIPHICCCVLAGRTTQSRTTGTQHSSAEEQSTLLEAPWMYQQ